MIADWRSRFDCGDFPFLFVQLAPYMAKTDQPSESHWAELREAQLMTTMVSRNTGMAVITDVGDEKDIHPKRKEPCGVRMAQLARTIAYNETVDEVCGPIYKSMKVDGDTVVLRFDHLGSGLEAKGDKLTGFTIAGEDGKFFNATAKIVGDEVFVNAAEVKAPTKVRYGWANFPLGNLWNKAGYPATPFRTDMPELPKL
jgi:sialate O-acetylesterase